MSAVADVMIGSAAEQTDSTRAVAAAAAAAAAAAGAAAASVATPAHGTNKHCPGFSLAQHTVYTNIHIRACALFQACFKIGHDGIYCPETVTAARSEEYAICIYRVSGKKVYPRNLK